MQIRDSRTEYGYFACSIASLACEDSLGKKPGVASCGDRGFRHASTSPLGAHGRKEPLIQSVILQLWLACSWLLNHLTCRKNSSPSSKIDNTARRNPFWAQVASGGMVVLFSSSAVSVLCSIT